MVLTPPAFGWLRDAFSDEEPARLIVSLQVRNETSVWTRETVANTGDVVEYQLRVENTGEQIARDVIVGVNLAGYQDVVPNSVQILNSNNPDGAEITDREGGSGGQHLFAGGLNIGDAGPGGVSYSYWQTGIDPAYAPGSGPLVSVGITRLLADMREICDAAAVHVGSTAVPPPVAVPNVCQADQPTR